MTTSKAAPSLAADREALDDRLRTSITSAVTRHCGAASAAKAALLAELADVARGYADAVRSQALADLASSVGELVTLARAYTGANGPVAKRGTTA